MLKIRPGQSYRVKNKDKKSSANDHYTMIIVEDAEGDIHELLFTDADLTKALIRGRKNKEDIPAYSVVVSEGGFAYAIGLTVVGMIGGLAGYFLKDLNLF